MIEKILKEKKEKLAELHKKILATLNQVVGQQQLIVDIETELAKKEEVKTEEKK